MNKEMKEIKVEFDEKGEPIVITTIHWDNIEKLLNEMRMRGIQI